MSGASRSSSPVPPAGQGAATATSSTAKHPLLAGGPLYAFALPQELLQVISLRSPLGGHAAVAVPTGQTASSSSELNDDRRQRDAPPGLSALGCNLCGVQALDNISEQRSHFSSDWHRYNVKRKMASKAPVGEKDWEGMVEDLSDSLTGSASSSTEGSSSEDDDDETTVSRVLAKQKISNGNGEVSDTEDMDLQSPRSPLLWFEAPTLVLDTQFGLYRTIFPAAVKKITEVSWLEDLRRLQVVEDSSRLGKRARGDLGPATDPTTRTWTLLAIGGGHFAGLVVSLVPKLSYRNGRIEREVQVLQSKTYHRYTTRRKQGGAQSANDNAKGNAKSAGAQIRRYNEAMLRDDIRKLLETWKEDVQRSELVFVRASKTSQRIFYDYDEPVLSRKDPRMRTFPFPTRRPTQAELIRCFTELTRIKLSHLTADELKALDDAYKAAMQPKKPPTPAAPKAKEPPKPEVPQLSKEELLERDRWERVIDMVKKGRLEALRTFTEKQQSSDDRDSGRWTRALPSWSEESRASPTLLHLAASSDQPDIVRYLLVDVKVDPTLAAVTSSEPATHLPIRTAYECSASRSVRDVFRRAYADSPSQWDWPNGARVPSQLTEEMEAQQNTKKAERSSKLKDKLKQKQAERDAERAIQEELEARAREAEEKRKEEERRMSTSTAPKRLGGAAPRSVLEQTQLKGLSEEAKMRIERERRARAAEARLQGRQ